MNRLLIILFSLLSFSLSASTVDIYVKDGAWGEVKLEMYEDHFTNRKSLYSFKKLDAEHKASFNFSADRVVKLDITVGTYVSSIYVLPDQEYEFLIYPYEQKIEVIRDDIDNTNEYIQRFNQDLRDYGAVNINTEYALSVEELDKLDDFIIELGAKYRKLGGPYFDLYKRMYMRSFRLDIAKKTENRETVDTILDSMLARHKLNYDMPIYVSFLKRWHYIKYYSFDFEYGADEFSQLKAIASTFKNLELQQFFHLNAIEISFKGGFGNMHLAGDDLDSILANPLNDELEIIAYNLKQLYYKFSTGDRLPNISLIDQNGVSFNTEDYNNEIIYLNFFTQWNSTSVSHLNAIKNVHERFKDDVLFVSVMIDASRNTLLKFLEGKEMDWTFLSTGLNHTMKEDFQLDRIPKYMIIGKDLKIITPVADAPNEETLIELEMILKGKH